MADIYQEGFGRSHPIAYMLPQTGVLLDLKGRGTITRHIQTEIRRDFGGRPLLAYLKTKYQWSNSTMQTIDWRLHERGLKKCWKKRNHYVKLIRNMLPTNAQLNKYDKGKRCCALCHHPIENREHVLRCVHPSRQKWRDKFTEHMKHCCVKLRTDPEIQKLLFSGLHQWISTDNPVLMPVSETPEKYHSIVESQQQIGWDQVFLGRWSTEWRKKQGEYLSSMKINKWQTGPGSTFKKLTRDIWAQQLMQEMWTKWHILWLQRNEDQHGVDIQGKALAARKEVDRTMAEIYDLRTHMEPRVQDLVGNNPMIHQDKPTWVLKNWIAMIYPVIKESVQKVRKGAIQGVRSIKSYFQSK